MVLSHVGEYVSLCPFGEGVDKSFVLVEVLCVCVEHESSVHGVGFFHAEEAEVDFVGEPHGFDDVGEFEEFDIGVWDAI